MRRTQRDRRGPWYLLTGLVIGAILGVLYAWVGQPVKYTDTKPSSLRTEFKDQYRALIASAYMANGDLLRARARLDLLQDADVYTALAEQAQRTLAGGGAVNINEARALGVLAVAIGQPSSQAAPSAPPAAPSPLPALSATPILTVTQIVGSPSPTGPTLTPSVTRPGPTRSASITPLPTRTFTPTPGSPFALQSQELSCPVTSSVASSVASPVASPTGTPGTEQPASPIQAEPLIVVQAFDAAGQGVPGVQVIVSWDGGESRFSTGLKPELGLGYADFSLVPGGVYTMRLAEGGQIIPDLVASECQAEDGSRFWGSWVLEFRQP